MEKELLFDVIEPEENTYGSLVADVTHRCNMFCANCYIPNRKIPDMDEQKLYALLKKLPNRTYIRLLGAEATLRDDLPEIIKTIRQLGHRVSLTTNGLKLSSLEYTQSLRQAGLRLVLISMNGADDDKIYQALDNGEYALEKRKAMVNAFKCGMHVNTGTIIAKGINEKTIADQLRVVVAAAKEAGRVFHQRKHIPPVLRIKSIGQIGRYVKESALNFPDLLELMAKELGVSVDFILDHPHEAGTNPLVPLAGFKNEGLKGRLADSYCFPVETEVGTVLIKPINWYVDDYGVPSAGNKNRGRITPDWKIAPFFEHVKANEFGY